MIVVSPRRLLIRVKHWYRWRTLRAAQAALPHIDLTTHERKRAVREAEWQARAEAESRVLRVRRES